MNRSIFRSSGVSKESSCPYSWWRIRQIQGVLYVLPTAFIVLVFFILVISQGLFADALFALIAVVNSAIGIRQELKAKEVLDSLDATTVSIAVAAIDQLLLRMKYNDGFVAYLNGTQIAERNAPASPNFSSVATDSRTYEETIVRIEYWGDEVERISRMNPVTGEVIEEMEEAWVYPATHYVTSKEILDRAIVGIDVDAWKHREATS